MASEHRHPAETRLRGRLDDTVRVIAAMLFAMLAATARRLTGRGAGHGWGLGFELLVAGSRGALELMPRIGVVRWRNAYESLLPLRTGGLAPRFVWHDSEPHPIHAAWLEPPGANDAVILYFHGGGYCFGSLRNSGAFIGALARATGARTLALEYRLAPEHPFPAAFEDALSAWRYVLGEGIAPDRIVLAGDSAGGNLALVTLLMLRDAGGPMPAAAVLLSPGADHLCSGASMRTNDAFDYISEPFYRFCIANYLGGLDPHSPTISPRFADLAGLPPLLMHAGGLEILVDQIRDFAGLARAAGVDVTLSVYEDMVHVWHMAGGLTPDAGRALDEIGAFVREHTGAESHPHRELPIAQGAGEKTV